MILIGVFGTSLVDGVRSRSLLLGLKYSGLLLGLKESGTFWTLVGWGPFYFENTFKYSLFIALFKKKSLQQQKMWMIVNETN